jgi:hypothetical protein
VNKDEPPVDTDMVHSLLMRAGISDANERQKMISDAVEERKKAQK